MRGCRSNTFYTIRNCTLSDITDDGNGAYNKTNTSYGDYVVLKDENNKITLVKGVKADTDGSFSYNVRKGRKYVKNIAEAGSVYYLHRYYRQCVSFPGVKMTVAQIKNVHTNEWCPYKAVI